MGTKNVMVEISHAVEQAIAGMLGGVISLVYAKKLSAKSSVITIVVSFVMSYYLGDILADYFRIPHTTAGFIVGLGALRLGAKITSGEWFNLAAWFGENKRKLKDD